MQLKKIMPIILIKELQLNNKQTKKTFFNIKYSDVSIIKLSSIAYMLIFKKSYCTS